MVHEIISGCHRTVGAMAQHVAKINISVFRNQYAVALSERWLSIDAAEFTYIKTQSTMVGDVY